MRKESLKKDGNKNGTSDADAEFDALFTQERRPSRDQRRSTVSSTPTNSNGDGAPAAGGDKSAANDTSVSGESSTPMAATTTKAARKHISYADDCKSSDGSASDADAAAENKDGDEDSADADAADAPATDDDTAASSAEQQDYEVEDIVAHKLKGKRLLFQVRWKNYTAADDTWEPEAVLDCPEIIERYRAEHPDAVGKPPKVKKPKKQKEVFEVEEIVGHRIERKRNVFLIRWKGFAAEQDTWEKEEKLLTCPGLLQTYKEAHQSELVDTVKKAASTTPKRSASERAAAKKEREERDYEVQAIVAKGAEKGHTLYLVHWKGYSAGSDTWEREENLSCPELIAKFEQQQSAKRPVSMRGAKERAAAAYEEAESEDEVMPTKKRRSQASGDEDYEVERIVDVKTERGKKVYLVKWKGWPASSNTWEPLASLSCADLLKKFEQSQSGSARKTTPLSKAARKSHTPTAATPRGRGRPPTKAATTPRGRGRPPGKATPAKSASPAKKTPVKVVAKSPRAASAHSSSKKKKVAVAKTTPAVTPRVAGGRKSKTGKAPMYTDADGDDVDPLADEPDWEVEKIVGAKNNRNGSRLFLIRWKGCKPSQDTWEPEENVDCPQLVKEFTSKQKATTVTASKTSKKKSKK